MAINIVEPPAAAREAVLKVLDYLCESSALQQTALRNARPGTIKLVLPMRMAFLPLDRIERGVPLREVALQTAWRFLVRSGNAEPAAAAQAVMAGSNAYRFGGLNEGAAVAGTWVGYRRGQSLPMVARRDYEPWLLAAPAIYTVGLWLHAPEAAADLVLPLPPSRTFDHYEPVPAVEFMNRAAAESATIPREDDHSGG
jgi:hypothetical protein